MTNSGYMKIPGEVLDDIYRHARDEFPNECCGWLVGPRDAGEVTRARRATNAYTPETHPTAKDRAAERAYVMEEHDLFELYRTLDGPEPPKVIYHSHPIGRAYFSETDQEVARSPWGDGPAYPVLQLVIGLDAERVVESRLFAWSDAEGRYVEVAILPGKQI
ncbi:MAG: Mov34/MPN/PAD-1 family protein [Chloroflexi bacterium]|nr:Mov34/MPN/PAD-1 family protein [Chloroflexota bacterium]